MPSTKVLAKSAHSIIVECNYTGQFARFLRGETGFKADGQIRKYDGEPFMPHHIVDGARELLTSKTDLYVPLPRNCCLIKEEKSDGETSKTRKTR